MPVGEESIRRASAAGRKRTTSSRKKAEASSTAPAAESLQEKAAVPADEQKGQETAAVNRGISIGEELPVFLL